LEPASRYEELRVPLGETRHGIETASAILGIPEWWPTGARVAVALAHGTGNGLEDPLLEHLQHELTERKFLTLRFNFPFWEARTPGRRTNPDPMPILEQTYRTALAMLNRDPTAAPAHLFLGGKGLGSRVAAQLATSRIRIDGIFYLGLPLHSQDKPEDLDADFLYRIVAPMLFVQGSRDRRCDLGSLRNTLQRIGAPTTLHTVEGADQNFHVLKKSDRTDEEVRQEVGHAVGTWLARELNESDIPS